MNLLKTLVKKEMLEFIRTKKFLVLCIVFLFVAVSSPVLAKLMPLIFKNLSLNGIEIKIPDPTWKDAVDQFVKNISQLAMIVVVFIFAGAVSEEKSKKTLELVLAKPVPKKLFIGSKFLSALKIFLSIYAVSALIFALYTRSIFGDLPLARLAQLFTLSFIYLYFVISLAILMSTLFANQVAAAGMAFFVQIILSTILGSIGKIERFVPSYIFGKYTELMANKPVADFYPSALVSLVLIGVMIWLSTSIFTRQEIER